MKWLSEWVRFTFHFEWKWSSFCNHRWFSTKLNVRNCIESDDCSAILVLLCIIHTNKIRYIMTVSESLNPSRTTSSHIKTPVHISRKCITGDYLMLNYSKSPDAQHTVNTKCKYDIILIFYKWKIYSLVLFENWFRPLKLTGVLHAFTVILQLPKLSCVRLLPNNLQKGKLGFICICCRGNKFNRPQIAMNLLMSMISFHDFAFVCQNVYYWSD